MLLGTGLTAMMHALSASPAINTSLRAESPFGDWRHVPSEAFYDAGEYYFEMGHAYVAALFSDFLAEAEGNSTSFADREVLLAEARNLLESALQRSPADAQAWASLALVAGMEGDREMQAKALRRSWELAPYGNAISPLRLMTLAVAMPTDPGPEMRAAIQRDVKVIKRIKRGSVEQLRKVSPKLDKLIADFEGA